MPINLDSYPTKNSDFEMSELDDEIILFSVANEKAVYLNASAQLIWHLCSGEHSITEIIEGLQSQYPEETNIASQTIDAIEAMIEDTVITLSSFAQKNI